MHRRTEDNWSLIDRLIEKNTEHYTHCIVRVAMNKKSQSNEFSFGRIDFCNEQTKPRDLRHDYGDFELIRSVISVGHAKQMLESLRSGTLEADDLHIPIQGQLDSYFYLIPSGMTYALIHVDWPTYYFSLRISPSNPISYEHISHKANLPPYPTKFQAVIDFIDLAPHIMNLSSELILVLPDFRARIKELSIMGNGLDVHVESNTFKDSDMVVKFYCKRGVEKRQPSPDIPVVNGMATFSADFEPDSVDATLVELKDNEMLDQKSFGGWHLEQKGIVIKTPQSRIADLIAKGESRTVEFKSSVQKMIDVLKTVVSFANTEGGEILVGVDDRGNIRGFYENREDTEKSVLGSIRGNCSPSIDVSTEWIEINTAPIMIIRVPEGRDKPYILKDNGIYIREGPNDYQIDRKKLDEMYQNRYARRSLSSY